MKSTNIELTKTRRTFLIGWTQISKQKWSNVRSRLFARKAFFVIFEPWRDFRHLFQDSATFLVKRFEWVLFFWAGSFLEKLDSERVYLMTSQGQINGICKACTSLYKLALQLDNHCLASSSFLLDATCRKNRFVPFVVLIWILILTKLKDFISLFPISYLFSFEDNDPVWKDSFLLTMKQSNSKICHFRRLPWFNSG